MSKHTILYASDLHGSNICFTKLIRIALETRPISVIIGGDLTGKEVIVVGDIGQEQYVYAANGKADEKISASILRQLKQDWGDRGIYHAVVPNDVRLKMSQECRAKLKRQAMKTRLQQWLAYAASTLVQASIRLMVIPGNDDPLNIDEDIAESQRTENVDERQVDLNGYLVVGLGYSNPTPWNCPRELAESEIGTRLKRLCESNTADDYRRMILVCHVPPYRSGLDVAPDVIKKNGEVILVPGGQRDVGSTSVRAFVDQYQPLLVLSGHCHDSPGFRFLGNSLCVNAGSSYGAGVLRAAMLVLDEHSVSGYQQVVR